MLKYAKLATSPRLQRLHKLLKTGREYSTREIDRIADICAVSTAVAELRCNGIDVKCTWRTVGGRRLYYYHMVMGKAPPIAIEAFGQDHWSTFAYLETRCVDHRGRPDKRNMRCDPIRHPGHGHDIPVVAMNTKCPTRLSVGELHNHDDWDCVDDMVAAGLVEIDGTGLFPTWKLTDFGKRTAGSLRAHRQDGGKYATFTPATSQEAA